MYQNYKTTVVGHGGCRLTAVAYSGWDQPAYAMAVSLQTPCPTALGGLHGGWGASTTDSPNRRGVQQLDLTAMAHGGWAQPLYATTVSFVLFFQLYDLFVGFICCLLQSILALHLWY
jgi:hypothetical protein